MLYVCFYGEHSKYQIKQHLSKFQIGINRLLFSYKAKKSLRSIKFMRYEINNGIENNIQEFG